MKSAFGYNHPMLPSELLSMKFTNPVGLAAGLDKNGEWIDALSVLGFGFIEVGTVTPKPQPGNSRPRLFRLKKDKALINRMGFNNRGAKEMAIQLKKVKTNVIIGGNIGKNKNTPNEEALQDYLEALDILYDHVDYFVINVSSPNTPGLRELQGKDQLMKLLQGIKDHLKEKPRYYPIFLKVAPDLTESQINEMVEVIINTKTDGLVATNTTLSRENLKAPKEFVEKLGSGGLSGEPLKDKSTSVIKLFREKLGPDFPIIGVGGIFTPQDAADKLEAGADLIQLYTGLIYEGPGLPKQIKKYLAESRTKK